MVTNGNLIYHCFTTRRKFEFNFVVSLVSSAYHEKKTKQDNLLYPESRGSTNQDIYAIMYGTRFVMGKSTLWFIFLFPRVRITITVTVFFTIYYSRYLHRLRFVRLFSTTLDQIVFAAAISRRTTSVVTS